MENITSPIKSYNVHSGEAIQPVDSRLRENSISVDNNTIVPESGGEVIITGRQTNTEYIKLGLQAPQGLYKTNPNIDFHSIEYAIYKKYLELLLIHQLSQFFTVTSHTNKFEFTECNYRPLTSPYGQQPPSLISCGYPANETKWLSYYNKYYIYPSILIKTAEVPSGNYTGNEFATALQETMNSVGTSNYTVVWTEATGILTISSDRSGGDGKFIILANGYQARIEGNSIYYLFYRDFGSRGDFPPYYIDSDDSSSHSFTTLQNKLFGASSGILRWEFPIKLPSS